MDKEEECGTKLLFDGTQGLSPERWEQVESELRKVIGNPDITPKQAFQRGFDAGVTAAIDQLLDGLRTAIGEMKKGLR